MTVSELMEELAALDMPDANVYTPGYGNPRVFIDMDRKETCVIILED